MPCYGQFTDINSYMRRAIIQYRLGSDGFYYPEKDVMTNKVDDVRKAYAFNKKSGVLYVLTATGNYEISLTKDYANVIKNNKSIPQLKDERLQAAIGEANDWLKAYYDSLNNMVRDEKLARRKKEIADSIAAVREAEEQQRIAEQQAQLYRNSHRWATVPVNNCSLDCCIPDCNNFIKQDSLFCLKIDNGNIYYFTSENMYLGVKYTKIHKAVIPKTLLNDKIFRYHCEVFKDSLFRELNLADSVIEYYNAKEIMDAFKEVQKIAPCGFVTDWSWDNDIFVTLEFNYFNTNKKTIKYLNLYWTITNDVGDVRLKGNFNLTGPVEYLNGASWNCDNSSYYCSGDASKMNITKLIITYMDGTKKVLSAGQIVYE